MNRRDVVFASLALGSVPIPAWTQQPGKVWRIGVLSLFVPPDSMVKMITWMLAPFGYEQERNLIIDYKFAQGRKDQLPALAAQLLAAKPDLLIGPLNDEINVLKQATATTPIVMMYAAAPVETGLISSLARPGRNLTGTTTSTFEGGGKMVQVFKETVPGLSQVTWLADPDFPGMTQYGNHIERVGAALGVRITQIAVRSTKDLDTALGAMERVRPDGLMAAMTGSVYLGMLRMIDYTADHKIPALYSIEEPVRKGGMMCYAPDFYDSGRRNGWQIDKIFKGAKPNEIPVEEPAKFRLIFNLKTASAMGLVIPPSMLLRADEVIQ